MTRLFFVYDQKWTIKHLHVYARSRAEAVKLWRDRLDLAKHVQPDEVFVVPTSFGDRPHVARLRPTKRGQHLRHTY